MVLIYCNISQFEWCLPYGIYELNKLHIMVTSKLNKNQSLNRNYCLNILFFRSNIK